MNHVIAHGITEGDVTRWRDKMVGSPESRLHRVAVHPDMDPPLSGRRAKLSFPLVDASRGMNRLAEGFESQRRIEGGTRSSRNARGRERADLWHDRRERRNFKRRSRKRGTRWTTRSYPFSRARERPVSVASAEAGLGEQCRPVWRQPSCRRNRGLLPLFSASRRRHVNVLLGIVT